MRHVGLIAGNGELPLLFVRAAREKGYKVVAVGHVGETSDRLSDMADFFRWVKVGQVGTIISFMRSHGVEAVFFAGGIKRPKLFGGVKLDAVGLKILTRARSVRDDALLREIAIEFERNGLAVKAPTDILQECLASPGVFSTRSLTEQERADAQIGWEVAQALGRLDVGQAVVVHNGLVVALEGIEGTDAMIERAGHLIGRLGGVLVKTSKPIQDLRFDLPTIGEGTVENLKKAGLTALIIEAGKSIVIHPVAVAASLKSAGLAVEVWG
jgi:hypothetical protein